MYQAEKVKIDTAMVERYMDINQMNGRELSEKMGHGRTYWNNVKARDGEMTPYKAKLLCSILGMDYNKLVIPERQNEHKSILEEDESLQALVNSMNRIEKFVGEVNMNMTRLEIQMRTVLKELGVK